MDTIGAMDNTTALVALISTSGTVLVAAIGAVGALFGERWREARLSAAQAAAAAEDRRYAALKSFSDALLAATQMSYWEERLKVNRARIEFTATLRKGEGAVARFSRELVDEVAGSQGTNALAIATAGSDELFAWLRGDRALKDLGSYAAD